MTESNRSDLERRLRQVEDQLAIYQLISAYGPLADGNLHDEAASLWTEDGVYDIDLGRFEGREAIAGFLRGELHQTLTTHGCSHILSLPHVVLGENEAVATNYSQTIVLSDDGRFGVFRAVISRWEFARTSEGWKVTARYNQAMNGSTAAAALTRRVQDAS
ncbi:nuclear transport factor 2 family protein [Streptomyces carpinensis]|uniref:Nuclear transport factor 2 family protein n=1 Tax=Streptomyces carpinensis TaxID=66369 RepID=A0ABV1VUQ7_9ACTN|nr:nuclear transport factor 2 family protein [Streptomyces carpinensis]